MTVKAEVEAIYSQYGMSIIDAINVFLYQFYPPTAIPGRQIRPAPTSATTRMVGRRSSVWGYWDDMIRKRMNDIFPYRGMNLYGNFIMSRILNPSGLPSGCSYIKYTKYFPVSVSIVA